MEQILRRISSGREFSWKTQTSPRKFNKEKITNKINKIFIQFINNITNNETNLVFVKKTNGRSLCCAVEKQILNTKTFANL